MKIYDVTSYDEGGNASYFYEATKADALERKRLLEADGHEAKIDIINVEPTREGIARALNDIIAMLCVNEH
jgi:hypothetical protein